MTVACWGSSGNSLCSLLTTLRPLLQAHSHTPPAAVTIITHRGFPRSSPLTLPHECLKAFPLPSTQKRNRDFPSQTWLLASISCFSNGVAVLLILNQTPRNPSLYLIQASRFEIGYLQFTPPDPLSILLRSTLCLRKWIIWPP